MLSENRHNVLFYNSSTKSGINEQSFRYDETEKGSQNRCHAFHNIIKENPNTWSIGIESGIICDKKDYYDIVCVTIMKNDNGHIKTISYRQLPQDGVMIPKEYWNHIVEYQESNYTITFGSIIERELKLEKDTWHSYVENGKMTRKQQIINCLRKLMATNYFS